MLILSLKTVAVAATIILVSNGSAIAAPVASGSSISAPAAQSPDPVVRVGSHSMQNGACFYTRYNFKGDKICYGPGQLRRLPNAIKNHFRSVKLLGYARVDLCSRKNLRGKCTTIYESIYRLPKALANTTYSLDIYKPEGRGYGSGGGLGNRGYDYGAGNSGTSYGGGGGYDDSDGDGY